MTPLEIILGVPALFFYELGETVIVNGDRNRAIFNIILFRKRILATFEFKRTALRTAQPKLYLMFCALFLKIALSAIELMSFGHLGAAI